MPLYQIIPAIMIALFSCNLATLLLCMMFLDPGSKKHRAIVNRLGDGAFLLAALTICTIILCGLSKAATSGAQL